MYSCEIVSAGGLVGSVWMSSMYFTGSPLGWSDVPTTIGRGPNRHRRPDFSRQAPPAHEPVVGVVVPTQLRLALQPAQEHVAPVHDRREVKEQRRVALDLDAGGHQPVEDLRE